MPSNIARCPYCSEWLMLDPTVGFPYARTRTLLHLEHCSALPPVTERQEIGVLADQIAERAVTWSATPAA